MDKKSVLIGALGAALLFVTMGASNPVTVQTTVPVSHEWSFHLSDPSGMLSGMAFAINARTGEVRKYNTAHIDYTGNYYRNYEVCTTKNY